MSLSNLVVKASYQGNGSTDTFAIPFDPIIDDSAETKVYIRDTSVSPITETLQVEGALQDYTLTGALTADDFHTNVVFNTAPAATDIVVIIREMPLTQTLNLTNSSFNASSVNKAFDRVVAMIQQLNEKLNRAPVMRVTEQSANPVLPEPSAGKMLAWDDTATNLENTSVSADILDSLTDLQTYVDAAQASATAAAASEVAAAATVTLASDHIADTVDAHDASAISNVPAGSIAATTVQAAINELDGDITTVAGNLSTHEADTSTHGVATIAGLTESQVFTNKDYDGGTASNTSRLTVPKAAKATLDALDRKEATLVYASDEDILYVDDGATLNEIGSGAGGGSPVLWDEFLNAPLKTDANNMSMYAFQAGETQALYTEIHVPSTYRVGNPIALNIKAYNVDTSGTILLRAISTLLTVESSDVASTTNQRTTTNAAITMTALNDSEIQWIELDITDSTGNINSVPVFPGDTILVRLYRDSDTATSDVYFLHKQCEVTFS